MVMKCLSLMTVKMESAQRGYLKTNHIQRQIKYKDKTFYFDVWCYVSVAWSYLMLLKECHQSTDMTRILLAW